MPPFSAQVLDGKQLTRTYQGKLGTNARKQLKNRACSHSWEELLFSLPPLPTKGSVLAAGASGLTEKGNTENPELYAVHPYRVVSSFHNASLGNATFNARKNKRNSGWDQGVLDAALLGRGVEAATMVAERASWPTIEGMRWPTFQDGAGGTDHGAVNNAALRLMLVQSTPSRGGIVLLPAWPCDSWAVESKLHAPGGTVVTARYDGMGTLTVLSVEPSRRRQDVVAGPCVKKLVFTD